MRLLLAPEPVPARPSTCARRSSSSILVIPSANASRSSEPNPSTSHSFLNFFKKNASSANPRRHVQSTIANSPDIPKALWLKTRLEPYPAHDTRIESGVRRRLRCCYCRCIHVYGLVQVDRQSTPSGVLALRGDRYRYRWRRRRRRRWWWFSPPSVLLMRAYVRDEEHVVARTWR